jgi:hypothetical protein
MVELLSCFAAASLQTAHTLCHRLKPDGSIKQGSFTFLLAKRVQPNIRVQEKYAMATQVIELGRLRELT